MTETSPTALLHGDRSIFLTSLSYLDLQRLREATKRTMQGIYPSHLITDREADRIIESLGPRVAEQRLKAVIDQGLV